MKTIKPILLAVAVSATLAASALTMTFDGNGGLINGREKYVAQDREFNGTAIVTSTTGWTLTPPEGKTFDVWQWGDTENTYSWTAAIPYASGITVKALWKSASYTVQFDGNGESSGSMSSVSMTCDTPQELPANKFKRTGYGFWGWGLSATAAEPAYGDGEEVVNLSRTHYATVTLYALWTNSTYVITLDPNNGNPAVTQTATYGTGGELMANPFDWPGHFFEGWAMSPNAAAAEYIDQYAFEDEFYNGGRGLTLYAVWSPVRYWIYFDPNGGEGSMENQELSYGVTASLSPNELTRTGYAFAGWNLNRDGSGTGYADGATVRNLMTVRGTRPIYAQWTPNGYSVAFDANGGTGEMADQDFTYDVPAALSPNLFTRPGYEFAGWTFGSEVFEDGATVSNLTAEADGEVTLVARWSVGEYRVAFEPNGGAGEMADMVVAYDVETNLTAAGFARTGYRFAGWATAADGTGEAFADAAAISNRLADLRLFAQWTPNGYRVRFDPGAGTGEMADQSFTYDVAQPLAANGFVKAGGEFRGWTFGERTFADGEVVSNLTAEADGEVTLVAQWGKVITDLSRAVDCTEFPFVSPGWTVVEKDGTVGGTCASAAGWDADRKSQMSVEVEGKGTLAFDWLATDDDWYEGDYLNVSVNGVTAANVSGWDMTGWATVTLELTNDVNTVVWEHKRNILTAPQFAYVDNVRWTPAGGGDEPGDGDAPVITAINPVEGGFGIGIAASDARFDYDLVGTNDVQAPPPWPVVRTLGGTGEALVFEDLIDPGEAKMFYRVRVRAKRQ